MAKKRRLPGEGEYGTDFDKAGGAERVETRFTLNIIQALTTYAQDIEDLVIQYKRNLELGHIDVRSMVSLLQGMPYTRAVWPMSSLDENLDVYDLSGQGRTLDNNNVTFGGHGTGLWVPVGSYNGSSRWLQRADENGLNFANGLMAGWTIAGWVRPGWGAAETGEAPIVAKGDGSVADEYHLTVDRSTLRPTVTANGESFTASSSLALALGTWSFVAASFLWGSEELQIQVDGRREYESGHYIASPAGTSDPFYVGRYDAAGGAEYWDGLIGPLGLYYGKLSDPMLDNLFDGTRHLFGV